MKKLAKTKDSEVREFEKRDLGKDILHSRSAVTIRPKTRLLIYLADEALKEHEKGKTRRLH